MEERGELSRTLKPQWVWAIAFGSAIGWGSFVQPATWMGQGGPLGAIIGFMIGAMLMIVIGVSYGFLIQKMPVSGGEFAYSYSAFERNHAFITGWALAFGYICIIALNATALALLAKFIFPGLVKWGYMYDIAGWHVYFGEVVITGLVLFVFAYMNIRGVTLTGRIQYIFCIALLVGVGILLIWMISNPHTQFSNMQPVFKPQISSWSSIIAIVAIAPWAFVGFDNIPQAAEEFNFPAKKGFTLIVLALAFAGIEYAAMITVTALGMPWQDLVAQNGLWGTGDIVVGTLGNIGLLVLAIALCMGIFTGLNGFYLSSSRLLFAMGRAKILPPIFKKLHTKYNTPYFSIIFAGLLCFIAPWFGRETLNWVVDMSSTGVAVAYLYTCIIAYRGFKWSSKNGQIIEDISPIKKTFALLGSIFCVGFLALLLIPGSPAFMGIPSLITLVIWILLGIVFYLMRKGVFQKVPKAEMDYMILGESRGSKEESNVIVTSDNPSVTPPEGK